MDKINSAFLIIKTILQVLYTLKWLILLMIIVWIINDILIPRYDIYIKEKKIDKKFEELFSWRKGRERLNKLKKLTPKEFEEYTAFLFSKLGYKTEVIGGSYDGGIDVIAEKNGIKNLIQCKKYFARHQVGVGAIRDFYGAMADKVSNGKGYFITTSKFTLEAERFAEDKPIELIDGFRLLEMIDEADI